MAYIETHQSLLTHRKTLRLSRLLGMDKYGVVGRLMALWSWALDNAQEGVIAHADSDILADVMGWDGEPSALCDALVSAGFLDEHANHFAIHDWMDYAGRLIERRKSDAERKRQARTHAGQLQTVQRTSGGHPADGVRTVPYPTVPEDVPTERAASVAPADASASSTAKSSKNGKALKLPARRKSDTTDRDYWVRVLKEASDGERLPLLVYLAHDKIGVDNSNGSGAYARIGALAKKHGAGLVATWILQAATESIAGDPLDYLTALASKSTNRASNNGHSNGRTPVTSGPNYAKTGEDMAPVGWK